MKSRLSLYCILLSLLFTTSCKDSGSPESITELFLISCKNLDFVTLNTISTKNTKDVLKILQHYTSDSSTVQKWTENFNDIKIKVKNKHYDNDSTVFVSFTTEPEMFSISEFKLIQVTEKLDKKSWKIDISTIEMYEKEMSSIADTSQYNVSHDGQINMGADSIAVKE